MSLRHLLLFLNILCLCTGCGKGYYLVNKSDKPLTFEVDYRRCTVTERNSFFDKNLKANTIASVDTPANDLDCRFRFSVLPQKKLNLFPLLTQDYVAADNDGNKVIYLIAINELANVRKDTILIKQNGSAIKHNFQRVNKVGKLPFLYFKEFTYTIK